ncbi:MAG: hypothetical protein IJ943_07620 [Akkermansia sp.]|nr:hypothetical protein [Akkermansia sp.]
MSYRCQWKKLCNLPLAVLMLLVGGLVLQPLNRAVSHAQHTRGLQLPPPRIAQKDAFTQQLAFFTLGGLRSLAAELTSLDATNAWSHRDWPRADARWQTVTTLAPRRVNYWVAASRDMATNAAGDILSRDNINRRDRTMQAHHYIQRGEDYLLSGLANAPDSPLLYARLGDFYSDLYRRPEFGKAAAAYARAVELGAPQIYSRLRFYNLCRIRGREQEALALGRELFADPRNNVPALRTLIYVLQHKLNLPPEQRLSIEQLFGNHKRARRDFNTFRRNTLLYPTNGIEEYLNGQDES